MRKYDHEYWILPDFMNFYQNDGILIEVLFVCSAGSNFEVYLNDLEYLNNLCVI